MITRPLLAGVIENIKTDITYPVLATPKLDGIRVLKVDGKVLTRKFKELPNRDIRTKLERVLPNGIDGEILLRNGSFNETQSQIMSFDGEPDYIFYPFDYVKDDLNKPYSARIIDLKSWFDNLMMKAQYLGIIDPKNLADKIRPVLPVLIENEEQLLAYEHKCLSDGYEGIMLRKPDGKYKCGRSTKKEGILLKLKRFVDSEAIILGFEEKMKNENIQETDEFGLAKRSSKKEGLVPAGTLGSIIVKDKKFSSEFNIGSGFDDELKKEIWDNQEKYLGKLVKYKYQDVGLKDVPRFPVFLGFRNELDT